MMSPWTTRLVPHDGTQSSHWPACRSAQATALRWRTRAILRNLGRLFRMGNASEGGRDRSSKEMAASL